MEESASLLLQGERKAGLPDWGWLVILGGSISTAIIGDLSAALTLMNKCGSSSQKSEEDV